MAFVTADIKLPEAARTVRTSLYFPTDLPKDIGNEVKGVIWLLHGYSNTGNDWMMMSAACRYAADNGYILIAPGMENSFYLDWRYGSPYYTMLTEYLPQQLERIFKIPQQRESTYICGLSMGGYGAVHTGLLHPERFAAIGSFSGALDLRALVHDHGEVDEGELVGVVGYGEELPAHMDLMQLAKQVAGELPAEKRPRLFQTVGRQDFLYRDNQTFRHAVEPLGYDYAYREWDGVHEWNFWDRSLAEFIGFIQNDDYGRQKQADWCST